MKPSIPRGTRDFGPAEMQKRQYIFNIIKTNFQLFGYAPIETPTMENLSTLTGKYGEGGDKLIFKILESGDYLKDKKVPFNINQLKNIKWNDDANWDDDKFLGNNVPAFTWNQFAGLTGSTTTNYAKELLPEIIEKGLRYDLTVPFARYVVMNNNKITYPFKRYQIQPVWRADKPQKGRYREFYQCDADVIGSNSLVNEIELINLIYKVYQELKIPIILKINNRKILHGIVELTGISEEKLDDVLNAIDEFEKIGREKALNDLIDKGFNTNQINDLKLILSDLMDYFDPNIKLTDKLKDLFEQKNDDGSYKSVIGLKGVEELEFIYNNIEKIYCDNLVYGENITPNQISSRYNAYTTNTKTALNLQFDITLARGLNYYTGTIFEAKANAGTFTPSILGGGRYDDLTGIFGLKGLSGVGISFGVDRIYDVMEELNLFPDEVNKASTTKLLFTNFSETDQIRCIELASKLRALGINTEVYPDVSTAKKQFEYAEKKQITFVGTIGNNEMKNNTVMLKNIATGIKEEVSFEKLVESLKIS